MRGGEKPQATRHSVQADAKNPNIVTSETHFFGLTRIVYDFDPLAETVTYTILQKPGLASNAQVWDGVHEAIRACS